MAGIICLALHGEEQITAAGLNAETTQLNLITFTLELIQFENIQCVVIHLEIITYWQCNEKASNICPYMEKNISLLLDFQKYKKH